MHAGHQGYARAVQRVPLKHAVVKIVGDAAMFIGFVYSDVAVFGQYLAFTKRQLAGQARSTQGLRAVDFAYLAPLCGVGNDGQT